MQVLLSSKNYKQDWFYVYINFYIKTFLTASLWLRFETT